MGYDVKDVRDHQPHLIVQQLTRLLAERLCEITLTLILVAIRDRSNDGVHAQVGTCLVGDRIQYFEDSRLVSGSTHFESPSSDLLQIILSARCDLVCAKEYLLGDSPAEGHADAVEQLW